MKGKASHRAHEDEDECDEESESEDGAPLFGSEAEATAEQQGLGEDDFEDEHVLSPFGPEIFPTADACWAHAEQVHGFSFQSLKSRFGRSVWTDYHRIRLVNYLRSLGPELARREATKIGPDSPLWADDTLLQPVLQDDALLFLEEEEDFHDAGIVPGGSMPSTAVATKQIESDDEVKQLRAEVMYLRGLLQADSTDSRFSPQVPQSAPPQPQKGAELNSSSWKPFLESNSAAEALLLCLHEAPERLQGRILNLDCGAGLLTCLCAQLGAKVVAADASHQARAVANALLVANELEDQVHVLEVSPEEILGSPEIGRSPIKGLIAERLLACPYVSPPLLRLLQAQERLRAEWVFPKQVVLQLAAGDFSAEADHFQDLSSWEPLLGLNLSPLMSNTSSPFRAKEVLSVDAACLASNGSFCLLELDLREAKAKELLREHSFRLSLKPEKTVTSLCLTLKLQSQAETSAGLGYSTVLHLRDPSGAFRRLRTADLSVLEGTLSISSSSTGVQIDVSLATKCQQDKPFQQSWALL